MFKFHNPLMETHRSYIPNLPQAENNLVLHYVVLQYHRDFDGFTGLTAVAEL